MPGVTCPLTVWKSDPTPPIEDGLVASRACRTPSIHHARGLARATAWTGAGRMASGKTAPETRKRAPANASGYDHDSWRVWMQTAAMTNPRATTTSNPIVIDTTSIGQSTVAGLNGTPSTRMPIVSVMTAPAAPTPRRATPRPSRITRKSLGLT